MLDARAADIVEANAMLDGKFPTALDDFGALDVLVRGEVIHDKDDLVRIKDSRPSDPFELLDGHHARQLGSQYQVDPGADELAGGDLFPAAFRCQDFLRQCHLHVLASGFTANSSQPKFLISRTSRYKLRSVPDRWFGDRHERFILDGLDQGGLVEPTRRRLVPPESRPARIIDLP